MKNFFKFAVASSETKKIKQSCKEETPPMSLGSMYRSYDAEQKLFCISAHQRKAFSFLTHCALRAKAKPMEYLQADCATSNGLNVSQKYSYPTTKNSMQFYCKCAEPISSCFKMKEILKVLHVHHSIRLWKYENHWLQLHQLRE